MMIEYTHEQLAIEVWEATREAWGYKTSFSHLMTLSREVLEEELRELTARIQADIEREKADEKAHEKAVAEAMSHRTGWTLGEIVS